MRIDLGLILAIAIEYILFVCYADTLFYKKRNKWLCYVIIAAGFAQHMVCCMFGNVVINAIDSVLTVFVCFFVFYHITIKNAIFQSILLNAINGIAEYAVIAMPVFNYIKFNALYMTPAQSIILTLTSRIWYMIAIMLITHIFCKGKQKQVNISFGLVLIPLLTVVVILLFLKAQLTSEYLAAAYFVMMIVNIVVFVINQKMISKEYEISELKNQLFNERIDLEEHMLLKEKYERTQVFRHDFKEHINVISTLIGDDNEQAKKYIESISEEEEMSEFTDYSDNKILNVILSQFKEKCRKEGIELIIDPVRAKLSFLSDIDTVSIFSNLINNAVEGCAKSENKKIYLSIFSPKDGFTVIKTENSAEVKPLIIDGKLKTHKDNDKLHGIGMNSIRRALQNYDGSLKWNYDEQEKFFLTTVVLKQK